VRNEQDSKIQARELCGSEKVVVFCGPSDFDFWPSIHRGSVMSKSMLKRVAVQKGEQSSEALFLAADNAGKVAAANVVPVPMHIKGYAPIEDGVCGFGWVIVKPAFSAFAKFLMKNSHGSKAYGGGVYVGQDCGPKA